MSKKSSTFVPAMRKTYYIPTIEIADIKGLNPLAFGDPSNKSGYLPPRKDRVF